MKKVLLITICCTLVFTNYYKIEYPINENITDRNIIEIKSIDLYQTFLPYYESSVDSGIIYLKETNIYNDFYILAAHSGNSNISHFNNLNKLKKDDIVHLYINKKDIYFVVKSIEYVPKIGKIRIHKSKDLVYLTTCDKYNNNRQLIVKCVKKV